MAEKKKNEQAVEQQSAQAATPPAAPVPATPPAANQAQPVKKSRKKFWIIFIVVAVLLILATIQSIRSYYSDPSKNDPEIVLPENINQNENINENLNTNSPGNTNSKKTNKNGNSNSGGGGNTPAPAPSPTPPPASSFDMLNFFAETATTYQTYIGTTERWTKSTVYVGGNPQDFASVAPIYVECMNQFIADFNASSSSVKLQRNDASADLKIYWLSNEEMLQYSGDMEGGSARTHDNGAGEIIGADVYLQKAYSRDDGMKCYLIRHEIYHAMGFAHSDQTAKSLMWYPSAGNNLDKSLQDVDKRAISMLYSSGLPLKQTADQIRAYFSTHSY